MEVTMAISKIGGVNSFSPSSFELDSVGDSGDKSISFGDYLKTALNNVSNLQVDSEKIADDFAMGKTDNIHEVLIAGEKADVALQLTMQIRNKVLDAYNEIMRMQI
jgi:flagellar hook-basal body complex protein FliE